MQRDPNASDKARRAERKAEEKSGLISIKPMKIESAGTKSGFKKGGFKNAFTPAASDETPKKKPGFKKAFGDDEVASKPAAAKTEPDSDDDAALGYEYYNPRKPTRCDGKCGFTTT
jgi:hypothetical protein